MYTRKYEIRFTLKQVLLIYTLKTNINLHSIKKQSMQYITFTFTNSTVSLLLFRITLSSNDS